MSNYSRKNPVPFEYDGMWVENPFTSGCGRFDVDPKTEFGVDVVAMKFNDMREEFKRWLNLNRIMHISADEFMNCANAFDGVELTQDQKAWLFDFIQDWKDFEDNGIDAFVTDGE